ncbi:peptidase [Micromonospora sp. NPDC000207]|uniref:peptidase n=1 Tax=Micromonospora sp. NPDC000207 TaxID=3154246 RepID=UPI0033275F84
MKSTIIRTGAAVTLAGLTLLTLPAPASAAPTPSPGATPVTRAGTSFLTATPIAAGQPVRMDAAVGDYLYWSFSAAAGERHVVTATVSSPKARSGASTWKVEVFDGLRRRQSCTDGAQAPRVDATTDVTLGCTLRQVRSWAEPWSADPLPGTYYLRLSVTDLPEADLGQPIEVELLLGATGAGTRDDGELKAPLVPDTRAGTVLDAEPTAQPAESDDSGWFDIDFGWVPDLGSRWIWSAVGGILAAVAGVIGFGLTRRPRRPRRP